MVNIFKRIIDSQKSPININSATNKVSQKFHQIADALDVPINSIYKLDENGVPFFGVKPSVLYDKDASNLKKISPIDVPTTFFITGDAYDTHNLSAIDSRFKPYDNMGIPNSHRLAQSLICQLIIDNPIYKHGKPLVPIGIDNHIFVSPDDVKKRLFALKVYNIALERKLPKIKKEDLEKSIKYIFSIEEKEKIEFNLPLITQLLRIFPNSLKVTLTNEPPSAVTHLGKLFSRTTPLAIVQMEFGIHPTYIDMTDNYYLYLSQHPINIASGLPKAKKNILLSLLPVKNEFKQIQKPPVSKTKRVIISSGGGAGRILRMIKELQQLDVSTPIKYLVMTGFAKNSNEYSGLINILKKNHSSDKFTLIPSIKSSKYANLLETAHAVIGFPGTYTTLTTICSGRPFGAVIDTRKSKDKIFTNHVKGNALFPKRVMKYPVTIFQDEIDNEKVEELIQNKNIKNAYTRTSEPNGIRDLFKSAETVWIKAIKKFLR